MSNAPILWATLGALIGLPAGYRAGQLFDAFVAIAAPLWVIYAAFQAVSDASDSLTRDLKKAGIE